MLHHQINIKKNLNFNPTQNVAYHLVWAEMIVKMLQYLRLIKLQPQPIIKFHMVNKTNIHIQWERVLNYQHCSQIVKHQALVHVRFYFIIFNRCIVK